MHPDKVNVDRYDDLPCLGAVAALSSRMACLSVSGVLLVSLMIVSTAVSAGGDFPSVDGAVSRQPTRLERHQELRRVLTTPDEYAVPRDERRRLSVDERDALRRELRESMRNVYDERRVKRR